MNIVLIAADEISAEIVMRQLRAAEPNATVSVFAGHEFLAAPQVKDVDVYLLDDHNEADPLLRYRGVVGEHAAPWIVVGAEVSAERRVGLVRNGATEYLSYDQLWPEFLRAVLRYCQDNANLKKRLRMLESRVNYLSTHDVLTDAGSRPAFFEALAESLEASLTQDDKLGVMLIHLDDFHAINEGIGQQAGDTVLKVVSQRIQHVLREEDKLYRIDGNEFAVILHRADDEASVRGAGERVLGALDAPLSVFTQSVKVLCSVGIARSPQDAHTVDGLVSVADTALTAARKDGGGVCIADSSMAPPEKPEPSESGLITH